MFKLNRVLSTIIISAVPFFIACSSEEPLPISEPQSVQYSDRGKVLVNGFAACGFCHGDRAVPTAPLSGGRILNDKYGEVIAPNITPAKSGIHARATMQLMRVFRDFLGLDGSKLSRDLHRGFEWMSDSDTLSIIAYLRTQKAVERSVDRRGVGFLSRNTTGVLESDVSVTGYVPEIERSYPVEYGKYIVDHVARCGVCHNSEESLFQGEDYLGGGRIVKNENGEKMAPNITSSQSSGIGSWSEDDIVNFFKTGEGPGNRVVDENFCPVAFYRNAPPEDLVSVAKYLRSVPPSDAGN